MDADGLTYRFEELPAFLDPVTDTQAGSLDGWAAIEFRAPDDWCIAAITLDGSNGRRGEACQARTVRLDPLGHAYLYTTIRRGLERSCGDHIAEHIAARIDSEEPGDVIADLRHAGVF